MEKEQNTMPSGQFTKQKVRPVLRNLERPLAECAILQRGLSELTPSVTEQSHSSSSNTQSSRKPELKSTKMGKSDLNSEPSSSARSQLPAMTEFNHPLVSMKSNEMKKRNLDHKSQPSSSARAQLPGVAGVDNRFSSMPKAYDPNFNHHRAQASSLNNAQMRGMRRFDSHLGSISESANTYDTTSNGYYFQAQSSKNVQMRGMRVFDNQRGSMSGRANTYNPTSNGYYSQTQSSNKAQMAGMRGLNNQSGYYSERANTNHPTFIGYIFQVEGSNNAQMTGMRGLKNQLGSMLETYDPTLNFNDRRAQASSSNNGQLPAVGSFRPPPGAASMQGPDHTQTDYIFSGMRENIRENHWTLANDGAHINPVQLHLKHTVLPMPEPRPMPAFPPMPQIVIPEEFWVAYDNSAENREYVEAFLKNPIRGTSAYRGGVMGAFGAVRPYEEDRVE